MAPAHNMSQRARTCDDDGPLAEIDLKDTVMPLPPGLGLQRRVGRTSGDSVASYLSCNSCCSPSFEGSIAFESDTESCSSPSPLPRMPQLAPVSCSSPPRLVLTPSYLHEADVPLPPKAIPMPPLAWLTLPTLRDLSTLPRHGATDGVNDHSDAASEATTDIFSAADGENSENGAEAVTDQEKRLAALVRNCDVGGAMALLRDSERPTPRMLNMVASVRLAAGEPASVVGDFLAGVCHTARTYDNDHGWPLATGH